MRELDRSALARVHAVLRAHAGLELPDWVVDARATTRMKTLGVASGAYADLLEDPRGGSELATLVESVRVGETRFFRHEKQTDALLDVVVPAWKKARLSSPRIWSAGCASGEEPYTLAIVLSAALGPSATPTVLATDVSAEAIAFAKRGVYPESAIASVPDDYRTSFTVRGDTARVRGDVAARVTFERQNLVGASHERDFDLVWCRNVLIYFEPAARKTAVKKLVAALAPGGFLFLGYSETLRGAEGLEAVHHGDQVLYRKARERAHAAPPKEAPRKTKLPPRATLVPAKLVASRSGPPSSSRRKAAAARSAVIIEPTDATELPAQIQRALAHRGLDRVTIDLDNATFLGDDVAPLLRRAQAAANAAGIALVLRAARPGAQRWLRRHGLPREEA